MPGFEHGFERAIVSFLSGIVTGSILKAFSNSILLDQHMILILVILFGLASVLDVLTKMKFWSTAYILGFIIGNLLVVFIFGVDVFILMLIFFGIYLIFNRKF